MEDYKPNSHKYKEEQKEKMAEKKVEKVVTGTVITKKKSGMRKFADEFISEDAKNIKSFVFGEVLIPAVKKAISDIVTNGIDMILYGGSRPGNKQLPSGQVSYRKYYDSGSYREPRNSRPSYTNYSYDDIIFSSRGEAETVLDSMNDIIDMYKVVSVADYKDMAGISGPYTDNNYGWTNLGSAEVIRLRDGGYMIKMPRAIPID